MANRLVTIGRAAEELQVSRDTLRRLAASGHLKTVRISRRVLVPASEIARIVEGGIGRYASPKAATATSRQLQQSAPDNIEARNSSRIAGATAHGHTLRRVGVRGDE